MSKKGTKKVQAMLLFGWLNAASSLVPQPAAARPPSPPARRRRRRRRRSPQVRPPLRLQDLASPLILSIPLAIHERGGITREWIRPTIMYASRPPSIRSKNPFHYIPLNMNTVLGNIFGYNARARHIIGIFIADVIFTSPLSP